MIKTSSVYAGTKYLLRFSEKKIIVPWTIIFSVNIWLHCLPIHLLQSAVNKCINFITTCCSVLNYIQSSCSSKITGTGWSEQIRCLALHVNHECNGQFAMALREQCFIWSAMSFSTCAVRFVAYCKTPILPTRLSCVIVDGRFCLKDRTHTVAYCCLYDTFTSLLIYSAVCISYRRSLKKAYRRSKNKCSCCHIIILRVKSIFGHSTLASVWFWPSNSKTVYLWPSNYQNRSIFTIELFWWVVLIFYLQLSP